MQINKIAKSQLANTEIENQPFGSIFSDHMAICDFKDGKWQTPQILPYGPFSLAPSTQVFHYGQAVFEGMKAYKDANGGVNLFRPRENQIRLNTSAKRLGMQEVPEEVFDACLHELLKIDKDWIPTSEGNSLYIRPFIIATDTRVSASASQSYRFAIITSPSGSYYSKPLRVKIADFYSRSASGGVGYAKAAGNYAAQFYPTSLAIEEGYDQVAWTDSMNHEYIEEAGTMNIFIRIKDTYYTAPISERILDGITRKSILEMMRKRGMKVEERFVSVAELKEASANGELEEAFGCGTAVIINPIKEFGYKGENFTVNTVQDAPCLDLKKELLDIQYNRVEDAFGWRINVL